MRKTLVLAATLAAFAATAAPAQAGTYDVWSCRLPDGKPAPLDGWRYSGPAGCNSCPYGGFGTSFPDSSVPGGATQGWEFTAPANLAVSRYELYRSAQAGGGGDVGYRSYALYHDVEDFDPLVKLFEFCTTFMANCSTIGKPFPAEPMDVANRVERSDVNAKRLILRLECRAPATGGDCGPSAIPGRFNVGRARITLNDALPPVLERPSGPLVTRGALLEGVQAVTLSATDEGGGLERVAVLADGATAMEERLDDVAATCRPPFANVVPCVHATTRTLAFNTAKLSNGPHAIQIAAIDAGGNRTLSDAVAVTTINGATANGSGATRWARVRAKFVGAKPGRAADRATVAFRGRRAIRGRLTGPGGKPIAGAVLDVVRRPLRPGARSRTEGRLKTRKNGRFRYMPRRGPSRLLRIEYRAFSLDPAPSAVATVTLKVRAGIRLVVKPRRTTARGTIRFLGKLLGGPGRRGVQVTLYAVGRTGRQRVPVAVLRADARGRFRFRYQFLRTFAPFTYRFLARIEKQPTYPYAAASSNRATVHVVR